MNKVCCFIVHVLRNFNKARRWHVSLGLLLMKASLGIAQEQPNILIFLADDLPWNKVGYNGAKIVETPNIDRIAENGVRLTSFYVQSVCTPTRAAFLTGRYPFRNGSMDRFSGTGGMLTDERTIADALRDAGYWTALVGKWHLGNWEQEYLPRQRGFDHQYGTYGGVVDYYDHARKYNDARGHIYDWHRNDEVVYEEGHTTDLIRDEAVRLIKNYDGKKPFFMYVPFMAPHTPHGLDQVPKEWKNYYQKKGGLPGFDPLIHTMDLAIGEIVDAVKQRGWIDDTLIIFFNDNGGHVGKDPNLPYKGGKTSYFEGGIRVPFTAQWPGHIPRNSLSDVPVMVEDLYPTLVKLAGGSIEQPLPVDGTDVWSVLAEDASLPPREMIWSPKVIRRGDWKFIEAGGVYYQLGVKGRRLLEKGIVTEAYLYNVKEDPYETKNQINEHPELVKSFRKRLAEIAKEIRQPAPSRGAMPRWAKVTGEEEAKTFKGFPLHGKPASVYGPKNGGQLPQKKK